MIRRAGTTKPTPKVYSMNRGELVSEEERGRQNQGRKSNGRRYSPKPERAGGRREEEVKTPKEDMEVVERYRIRKNQGKR